MKKSEFIERYGLEAYKAHNERNKERNKEHYTNDPEFRKVRNNRNNELNKERYANDIEFKERQKSYGKKYMKSYNYRRYILNGKIELIENYNDALNDNFIGWDIHHKDEIRVLPSGMIALRTREELIENGRYYNCPANELIWMRKAEHMALHAKYRRR